MSATVAPTADKAPLVLPISTVGLLDLVGPGLLGGSLVVGPASKKLME